MNRQRFSSGFTVVELLVVIIIIGILATLVVTQFLRSQDMARDARNIDSTAKVSRFFEAYFVVNNTLPTAAQLNDQSWRASNGFSSGLLTDAQGQNMFSTDPFTPPTSTHVNILLFSDAAGGETCSMMVQVRKEATNEIVTKYVNNCREGQANFTSFPTDGTCPARYEFSQGFGGLNIEKDPTTGFCVAVGGNLT